MYSLDLTREYHVQLQHNLTTRVPIRRTKTVLPSPDLILLKLWWPVLWVEWWDYHLCWSPAFEWRISGRRYWIKQTKRFSLGFIIWMTPLWSVHMDQRDYKGSCNAWMVSTRTLCSPWKWREMATFRSLTFGICKRASCLLGHKVCRKPAYTDC